MDLLFDPLRFLELLGLTVFVTFAIALLYPQTKSRFKLYFKDTPENHRRIDKCPDIKRRLFFPTLYLGSGHLQAFFGGNSKYHDPNIAFNYEMLDLPDGGKIAMHWGYQPVITKKAKKNKKNCIIIILPGLTASSHDPYLRNISSEAIENGYSVVIYHPRGNQSELIFPKEGYLNLNKDFDYAVQHVKNRYPNFHLFAIGHSYGANVLTNYLGTIGQNSGIEAAATAANPFNFNKASSRNQGSIYDKWLAKVMIRWAKRNEKAFKNAPPHYGFKYEEAIETKSMTKFDDLIVSKMLGHKDWKEYYNEFSCDQRLKDIKIPLFTMNSADDPILDHICIPREEYTKNENQILMVTAYGGHVGWFTGFIRPKRWYPKPTIQFLNCIFEEITTPPKAHK